MPVVVAAMFAVDNDGGIANPVLDACGPRFCCSAYCCSCNSVIGTDVVVILARCSMILQTVD
jgi:hypothetical protein